METIHQKTHLRVKKKKKKHLLDKPVPGSVGRAAQEVQESFLFSLFPASLLSSLPPFLHSVLSLVKIQIPSLYMLPGTVKHHGSYFLLQDSDLQGKCFNQGPPDKGQLVNPGIHSQIGDLLFLQIKLQFTLLEI